MTFAIPKSVSLTTPGARRDEDVLRLQIAVHDPELVGSAERRRDLLGDVDRALPRHPPSL